MNKLDLLGDIPSLLQRYVTGELTPTGMVEAVHALIHDDPDNVWIHKLPLESLRQYARKVEERGLAALPLYGVPFAIKDNIDLAGVPTTAACPAFAYTPPRSATVVQRLIDAGAIPIGKTNLDQFATGLNGTRSPYGVCRNAFNPEYISGGSSSGSAVAVAKGWACFSLGTDTAGSGRVPAAFNNLIGHKPTRGWLSTRGVVPACRSLDCVSIFAFTAADAERVLEAAASYDEEDIYSRQRGSSDDPALQNLRQRFRSGIPPRQQLQFFGNLESARLFEEAVTQLQALGGEVIEIDFSPFLEAAHLLYGGPWVAERYAAIQQFFDLHSDEVISPVQEIIAGAHRFSAADAYNGLYRLRTLKRQADRIWSEVDCLLTPTAGTIYRIEEMLADPIRLNTNLGYYTNYINLLDYSAVAVPAGFQKDGLPFGVTLVAPAHQDGSLLHLAARLQQVYALPLGATDTPLEKEVLTEKGSFQRPPPPEQPALVRVAVCGAHLSGLPLNPQLTSRNGRLVASTTTSPDYKFYALPGIPPLRPGLVRVDKNERGAAIEVEVWELPASEFGSFVAGIPAPLGIGTITLAGGESVQGFLCEGYAVGDARDISQFGGWRRYMQSTADPIASEEVVREVDPG
ncbi:allophanate hydrolase [Nitrosospira multiformis ATCC 25196]|uniref:Allophanate hydrolase n=1 Tax=Nitrosospira multiformis (strain ATCC 25196 / NCIMB 11849 / C 71) TaxID=323848 RepID=Q2YAH4_NITMU|nr:allophanate hydrolase [Nitrosospira multiformis]ABB74247.1 Amidase [Nitrosospira multiformis ATCC 25196]SEF48628.1 allophanate hydrolase [Nitrosospira multiformis ATCC 25196]